MPLKIIMYPYKKETMFVVKKSQLLEMENAIIGTKIKILNTIIVKRHQF